MTRSFTKHAHGSVLIKQGDTWVLCTACAEDKVPPFLKGTGRGWVTAEYSLLPGATATRKPRERAGKPDSRSTEISRLVGRALRAAVDLSMLGERTITIDCDVLQADGGTRCASITGGMAALEDAIAKLLAEGKLSANPLRRRVAAVSVGIDGSGPLLDLDYEADSTAGTDMNFVMTDRGEYVEIQGTAEGTPFTAAQFDAMRGLAAKGIRDLFAAIDGRRG